MNDDDRRVHERLDGRVRERHFEEMLLDAIQLRFGTIGRGYLETRFRLAAIAESSLVNQPVTTPERTRMERYMDADAYQRDAARTLIDKPDWTMPPADLALVLATIALAASVGKLAEYVKKGVFHRKGIEDAPLRARIAEVAAMVRVLVDPPSMATIALPLVDGVDAGKVMLLWNAIGLIGESGEVADLMGPEYDPQKMRKELGDVCWYTAALATKAELSLAEVMGENIAKLRARYPDGWDSARSHKAGETSIEERAPLTDWTRPESPSDVLHVAVGNGEIDAQSDAAFRAAHDRVWRVLTEEMRTRLLDAGRTFVLNLYPAVADRLAQEIQAAPDLWATPYHFGDGMAFRNALRVAGIRDADLPTGNLDDYWVRTFEALIAERTRARR